MHSTKVFTVLLFAALLGSALALNGNAHGSKDDDDDDGAFEAFIDVINGLMAIGNVIAFIFQNGLEEALVRFCAVVVALAVTISTGMVIAACLGIDPNRRPSRSERNVRRAIGFAANVSMADSNLRAYGYCN
jgi:Na+/H+-dicarboxylate symporter